MLVVRLAGRDTRDDEKPMTTVGEIVSPLARAISPLLGTTKVVMFGHSLGALLGLELVYELRRRKLSQPDLFVASGRTVPGTGRTLKLNQLPDGMLIREVQRIYGGIPREVLVEREMLKRTLPILRADLAVNEAYEAGDEAPIDSSILALGGADDPHVTRTELEQWHKMTRNRFECAQFNGGHFYLADEGGQRWVMDRICKAVETLA